jgi:hypothetical protein
MDVKSILCIYIVQSWSCDSVRCVDVAEADAMTRFVSEQGDERSGRHDYADCFD